MNKRILQRACLFARRYRRIQEFAAKIKNLPQLRA